MIFILPSIILTIILSIPIYFILRWSLKKIKIGNDKSRKYIALLPYFIFLPIIFYWTHRLVILLFIFLILNSSEKEKPFNVNEWRTETENRHTMSKDIIDSKLLVGKTKDEVVDLLGNDFIEYEDNYIEYDLGIVQLNLYKSGLVVLNIYFENDIVCKVMKHRKIEHLLSSPIDSVQCR